MSVTPPMPPADPAPEWAVEMARRNFRMTARELAECDSGHDVYRFARALTEAYNRGVREGADTGVRAILSLIAQPPKPERSDGSEAEGREEA